MKKFIIGILGVLCLSSHELFLKTDSHFLKPEKESLLYLFNGNFELSENIISRDRIVNAQIHGPQHQFRPVESDYYDQGNVTFLKWKTGSQGTYVAGISTLPRTLEMNAEDFLAYLEHEELTNLIAEREAKGISNLAAKEKYSKHVKSLLQVGKNTSSDFTKILGYPIEFIPIDNPYQKNHSGELSFQLLWNNKPLAKQVVHFACKNSNKGTSEENSTLTDEKGVVRIKADKKGQWYLATIFIEESSDPALDYESNWATITFEVKHP